MLGSPNRREVWVVALRNIVANPRWYAGPAARVSDLVISAGTDIACFRDVASVLDLILGLCVMVCMPFSTRIVDGLSELSLHSFLFRDTGNVQSVP